MLIESPYLALDPNASTTFKHIDVNKPSLLGAHDSIH